LRFQRLPFLIRPLQYVAYFRDATPAGCGKSHNASVLLTSPNIVILTKYCHPEQSEGPAFAAPSHACLASFSKCDTTLKLGFAFDFGWRSGLPLR
jgi:hypothetical protein